MKFKKILFTFVFFSLATSLIADSGIYICGHFRRDRTKTVTAVKESGFTFGILFNVHVETDGTLTTDGEVICKNGQYVFDQKISGYNNDKAQVDYVDDVNSLLSGRTSLLRLEHCIGGWGNHAYQNVTNLVNTQGTGASSILYRNFKALKDAIPSVIAINNDIEHDYDATSQAKFHIMLYDIGFKTTIAPYTNKSYWESFVQQVENARPGAVDRNYLQCYGGGAGNNPKDWKIKNIPIYGSRDIEANPNLSHQTIVSAMTNWKNNAGIVGGFYWNYNYDRDLKKFSAPINEVFGGGEVVDRGRTLAMVFPVKDYKAPQTDFVAGSYTKSQIQQKGFDAKKIASVKLNEGVKMVLFSDDNFSGDSIEITGNNTNTTTLISQVNSWRILGNSLEQLTGKSFYIKNKQSGFVLKPSRNGTALTINQMLADTTDYSLWTFELAENGFYKIVNKGSKKALQTVNTPQAVYLHDGLSLVQLDYTGGSNQHFLVKKNTDDSYKLILYSSLKYVGIPDNSAMKEKVSPVIRRLGSALSTDWQLIPANETSGVNVNDEKVTFKVYNSVAKNEIIIESAVPYFSATVLDFNGRVVIGKQQIERKLDVSKLTNGVYLLHLQSESGSTVVRFIKI